MAYKEDYAQADGWSVADVSVRLNTAAGKKFLDFLRASGVDTLIRYYASSNRPKTITPEEAKFLSKEGFAIVPVFQDRARKISDFSAEAGAAHAQSALEFAKRIGQPNGSTILFAVDADYTADEIDGPIVQYFKTIKDTLNGAFAIGAYGSGALLAKLLTEGLISVPWLSMSRSFLGTESFFYSNQWFLRQVPPTLEHTPSRLGYDRNVVRVSRDQLGAFQVDEAGEGQLAWHSSVDATLEQGEPDLIQPVHVALAGANRFVTTEGLRLRRTPNGTILRELTLGNP
ncbi:MAG: DUF1906 domain-containing protein [Rubrivivax sp.]|nr:MAG: DUF1906 domain-containing protein [Rubrivivax sp.]